MYNLADIQSTARTALAAATLDGNAFYEDADVIADDGTKKDEIEARLNSRGFVVVVEQIVGVRITNRAPNVNQGEAAFAVSTKINPKVNAANLNRAAALIVDVNASALLAYGSDPTDRFELEDEAVSLICDDWGLIWHLSMFNAQTVLAPYVTV